jgi:hypothetical protein
MDDETRRGGNHLPAAAKANISLNSRVRHSVKQSGEYCAGAEMRDAIG